MISTYSTTVLYDWITLQSLHETWHKHKFSSNSNYSRDNPLLQHTIVAYSSLSSELEDWLYTGVRL